MTLGKQRDEGVTQGMGSARCGLSDKTSGQCAAPGGAPDAVGM